MRKLIRRLLGLPNMPIPKPGQPVSLFLMAGYVFSVSLDLTLIGGDSGVSKLKKVAPTALPPENLDFQFEFISLSMAAFAVELERIYGPVTTGIVMHTAAQRLSEQFQTNLGERGTQIEWPKVAGMIDKSVRHYSEAAKGINSAEDLIRFSGNAGQRILKNRDPFAAAAIAEHFTTMLQFARSFVSTVPLQ